MKPLNYYCASDLFCSYQLSSSSCILAFECLRNSKRQRNSTLCIFKSMSITDKLFNAFTQFNYSVSHWTPNTCRLHEPFGCVFAIRSMHAHCDFAARLWPWIVCTCSDTHLGTISRAKWTVPFPLSPLYPHWRSTYSWTCSWIKRNRLAG